MLATDEPAVTTFTARQIRRNMTAIILLDSIFGTGYTDLGLALTPLWVYLKASNRTIGLISSASAAALIGMFLSPWITRWFHAKKWYLFVANIPYLLPIGVAGIGILLSQRLGMSSHQLLLFVTAMMVLNQFFAGFVSLPHNEYIAACIPMSHRGRYSGLSGTIGSLMSMLSMALGGWVLLKMRQPMSFGVLMLATWVICQGGYVSALFAQENPVPVAGTPRAWSGEMLRAAWANKPFLRVLLLQSLGSLTFIPALGFINYYGMKQLHMVPATMAVIGMLGKITAICTIAPAGWLIDRLGPKRVWPFAALGAAITYATVLLVPGVWGVYAVPVVSGILLGTTWGTPGRVLLFGLPTPANRAGHYTIQLLLFYGIGAVGGVLTGWMYDLISYRTGFLVMLGVSLLMFPLMKWVLRPLSDDAKAYS